MHPVRQDSSVRAADHPSVRALSRSLVVLAVVGLLLSGAVSDVGGASRPALSYLVVGRDPGEQGALAAGAAVRAAGGRVVQAYPQIGVALGYGAGADFAARLRGAPAVLAAGATRTAPLLDSGGGAGGSAVGAPPLPPAHASGRGGARGDAVPSRLTTARDTRTGAAPGPGSDLVAVRPPGDDVPPAPDPQGREQWNQRMMSAVMTSRSATPARPSALRDVVVAVLDSGVDDTHPDLRNAVDPARSASCAGGSPDGSPGAWRPDPNVGESGHGTHVSGIIAADRPGDGVAGLAPGVRIAAVRLLGAVGQYYGENLVCGFLWAADHGARVINDSYFMDPWKYNCPENPDQAAVVTAVGRAVAYAQRKGALVVASAGNDAQDLGAPRTDDRSPNDRPDGVAPLDRHLGVECVRLPGGLPGVLDVTAVDADGSLAGYSNWGTGRVQLAAPGGDPDGGTDQAVVSDWPGGGYAALAGTSMAAAHVSGAAAVEAALHPGASGAELARLLEQAALRVDCSSGRVGGAGCPGAAYYGYGLVELPTQ